MGNPNDSSHGHQVKKPTTPGISTPMHQLYKPFDTSLQLWKRRTQESVAVAQPGDVPRPPAAVDQDAGVTALFDFDMDSRQSVSGDAGDDVSGTDGDDSGGGSSSTGDRS